METITLKFKASGQKLTADSCPQNYASNTVNYIQAEFDLDANWKSFDSVRAVWHNDFACISAVLDGNGKCTVPHEVLENLAETQVNLVGSIIDGTELTDRLTTYPIRAAIIDAEALICGTETAEVTPSQFEQYIAIVEQIVGTVKDIDHTELTDDYCLIIYYSDGTNSGKLGPIRGATGATGNGIVSAVLNADYTLTLTYDNGDSDTVGPIRGAQGETGNGIESIYLTETHGAVKTYTILFTDGTTTTFDVTDGEVTLAQLEQVLPTDTASGAIASFPDGSDLFDYLSCVVNIEPVQDLHGYDKPWVGGGGKNKFDASATSNLRDFSRNGETFTNTYTDTRASVKLNVVYYSNGSQIGISNDTTITTTGRHSLVLNIPSGTDKLKIRDSGSSRDLYFEYAFNGEGYYTLSADFTSVDPTTIGGLIIKNVQIESGQSATTYEPYSNICPITGWTGCNVVVSPTQDAQDGTTYSVSWQTEAGTVYGGTVDLVTGVLTVTWGSVDLYDIASNLWLLNAESNIFSTAITNLESPPSYADRRTGIISSQFPVSSGISLNATMDDNSMLRLGDKIYIRCTSCATTNEFHNSLNNAQLVYKFATPQTYQLTGQQIACLLGQNNVWANCGDTSVTYKADVQRWVEKKLGA